MEGSINKVEKVIIEVGSTNTKIDLYNGQEVKRMEELTILFKQNYQKNKKIMSEDCETLINKVKKLKKKYQDIFVCGTSIFRDLSEEERNIFLRDFEQQTGEKFHIITQKQENELTVLGATREVEEKVCVFVGGGGSTEISISDHQKIIDSKNSLIGVMDIMDKFPDLASDLASTSLEEVMDYIETRLEIPNQTADILILAGGGHETFARGSGIKYENNTQYQDICAPIMMDIHTRIEETKRYYEEISLEAIKKKVPNPDWWFATRAMCAFVLVVAKKVKAKYIIPTNISMVYGIIENI